MSGHRCRPLPQRFDQTGARRRNCDVAAGTRRKRPNVLTDTGSTGRRSPRERCVARSVSSRSGAPQAVRRLHESRRGGPAAHRLPAPRSIGQCWRRRPATRRNLPPVDRVQLVVTSLRATAKGGCQTDNRVFWRLARKAEPYGAVLLEEEILGSRNRGEEPERRGHFLNDGHRFVDTSARRRARASARQCTSGW